MKISSLATPTSFKIWPCKSNIYEAFFISSTKILTTEKGFCSL